MTEETVTYNIPTLSDEMLSLVPALSPQWRFVNLVMAFFFFFAAVANMNDNDWYIWTPIYLCPSILCVLAFLHPNAVGNRLWQLFTSLEFGLAILLGLYQISKVFDMSSKMLSNPLVNEEGREMGGLIIILAWTGISRFFTFGSASANTKNKQSSGNLMTGLLVVALTLAVVPLITWSLCFVGDWHKHLGHCSGMFNK